MLLPDDFIECARPHPRGERLCRCRRREKTCLSLLSCRFSEWFRHSGSSKSTTVGETPRKAVGHRDSEAPRTTVFFVLTT
jgi:hypothetical protein